jgi:hypothetical protein
MGVLKSEDGTFMLFQKETMDLINALISTADNEGSLKSFNKHS